MFTRDNLSFESGKWRCHQFITLHFLYILYFLSGRKANNVFATINLFRDRHFLSRVQTGSSMNPLIILTLSFLSSSVIAFPFNIVLYLHIMVVLSDGSNSIPAFLPSQSNDSVDDHLDCTVDGQMDDKFTTLPLDAPYGKNPGCSFCLKIP